VGNNILTAVVERITGGGEQVAKRSTAESSRLLVKLLELSQQARAATGNGERSILEGMISPQILRRLLTTLHSRDPVTVQHSRRVSKLALGIAGHLRWEEPNLRRLDIAALLHDVGKIGVPDNVLFKPGKLNRDESDLMSLHHHVSVDVLQAARVDPEVIQIIGQSRDFSCGAAGCPGRALGMLHQGARILSVADAYDSLRSKQVFHQPKSHDDTMKILLENTGTQFDGNVINALARWAGTCGLNKATSYPSEQESPEAGPAFSDSQDAQEADTLSRIFSHLYLLEDLYDGFYLVDADLRFVVWNDGIHQLVGQSSDRLLDRVWTSRTVCYADDDGRELSEDELPLKQVLESGQPTVREVKILNAAGRWTDVELQSIPLIDDAGRLRGVAEIVRERSRTDLAPREYRDKRRAAGRDSLTGVANRSELQSQLVQLLDAANKDDWKIPFSVIFIDVDHIQEINNRFGHDAADRTLIETARLLQQETYSGEVVGRHDGGQFMIVCPATGGEQATKRAERIRLALSGLTLTELEDWPITGTFGVTQAESGDSVESVISRADKALYVACRDGRNQTVFQSPGEHSEPLLREGDIGSTHGTFELDAEFKVCMADEMVVYKIGGFVIERDARLQEVTPELVRMRLGRTGFFSSWGRTSDRKPVDVELHIGSDSGYRVLAGRKVKSNHVQVRVRIVPVGRVRSREVFLERARDILKDLANFLLAEV
jgi:diguanylate cyclase (GGDEF)-like protein/putative nucleotidyltransferase with HDIG domain/PAS domain S-box-containing protein